MIRPVQIRAARSLLGMGQVELARRAGVGLATLQRIEAAGTTVKGTARTLLRLQAALEAEGVVFMDQTDERGPGVYLRRPLP